MDQFGERFEQKVVGPYRVGREIFESSSENKYFDLIRAVEVSCNQFSWLHLGDDLIYFLRWRFESILSVLVVLVGFVYGLNQKSFKRMF